MKQDKNILIIGASRGIGAAVLSLYEQRAANIVAASRSFNELSNDNSVTDGTEANIHRLQCDATDNAQLRALFETAQKILGHIDVILYNAGVGEPAWIQNFRSDDVQRVFAINLHGLSNALAYSIPLLLRQGGGVFAGVSSLADARGYPGSAAYCSSKAAASTLLEAARIELRPQGVHVITIRPGFVRTDMTDKNEFHMPFLIEPDRAARAIVRGISRRKTIVQFPWQIALATRIIRVLPNVLFDMAARKARKMPKDAFRSVEH